MMAESNIPELLKKSNGQSLVEFVLLFVTVVSLSDDISVSDEQARCKDLEKCSRISGKSKPGSIRFQIVRGFNYEFILSIDQGTTGSTALLINC